LYRETATTKIGEFKLKKTTTKKNFEMETKKFNRSYIRINTRPSLLPPKNLEG
jgi:hypothetical protein